MSGNTYGYVYHDQHIERRNREWNPATELSPRQIDNHQGFDELVFHPGETPGDFERNDIVHGRAPSDDARKAWR